jgi:hypothetical protein
MNKIRPYHVEPVLRYFFIILTIPAIINNAIYSQWDMLLAAILTLFFFLLPTLFSKWTKIVIPSSFQIILLLFVFGSMYLGEIQQYFYKFGWWDAILHITSSVIWGFIGFLLVFGLNKDECIVLKLKPFFIAMFTFCFSITISVIWEIFEFGADSCMGVNMQKARNLQLISGFIDTRWGSIDTMRDLVFDVVGALGFSLASLFYIRKKVEDCNTVWKLRDEFFVRNPQIFNGQKDMNSTESEKT